MVKQPSAHVVSKVNAILFKSDQGPVSNLLLDDELSNVLPTTSPPPPTREIQFPRNTNMPDGISPQRTSPQRSIHFDASLATSYVLDEEIVQLRHTAAIVANLQIKLKDAKHQAAHERAMRKRKEKNLIKLAKEMNVRNQEKGKISNAVHEMEETIIDLEERLAIKSRELVRLEAVCEQHRHTVHCAEVEQAKHEAKLARQELLDVIHGATHRSPKSSSLGTVVQHVICYTILLMVCSIAFLRSPLVHPSVMNIVCAPMPPGSYVAASDTDESRVFTAPYWAPEVYKRELFAVLCPGRKHTTLKQVKWKVEVLSDGMRVWKGRAGGGFHVYDDAIVMMGRKYQELQQLNGPWTLS